MAWRRKWPCVQKGQREGNYDSDRFRSRTLRYSLRRAVSLDSVDGCTHNPTVEIRKRVTPSLRWLTRGLGVFPTNFPTNPVRFAV